MPVISNVCVRKFSYFEKKLWHSLQEAETEICSYNKYEKKIFKKIKKGATSTPK